MAEKNNTAPLEDLMAAMDVVDTLRHQQDLVDRELDDKGRRERFLSRLRELYQAQGIAVPDHVLEEGIAALEEERFQYRPTPSSWRTRLAHMWVSRGRWGKPAGVLVVIGALFSGIYFATDVLPERRLRTELPRQLVATAQQIEVAARNPEVALQAKQAMNRGKAAVQEQRIDDAQAELRQLESVNQILQTRYTVRVVSRPGEASGVFRIPEVNNSARNYYLIVEAIDDDNSTVALEILDEENNQTKRVKTWGLRVSEQTYNRIANDKRDDGIIQNNQVGVKAVGYLKPEFSVPTTGGTITSW